MSPVLFPLPGNERMAAALADGLKGMGGRIDVRRFPDGDSYVRIDTTVSDRTVILVCTLDRPDEKFLQLSLVAATARDLGAAQVGLVCPYLPYMRQDARFRPGEAISSRYFAHLLEVSFDWLVTVDPHLHRIHSLNQLFAIPAAAVHAAPYLADWIRNNVENPLLIGPDSESEQWVGSVVGGCTRAGGLHDSRKSPPGRSRCRSVDAQYRRCRRTDAGIGRRYHFYGSDNGCRDSPPSSAWVVLRAGMRGRACDFCR